RQRQQAEVEDQRAVTVPTRREELVQRPALALALHLDAGLVAHAGQCLRAGPGDRPEDGHLQAGETAARIDSLLSQPSTLAGGDPGHEGQIICAPTGLGAVDAPAADVAMLDGVRPGGRWI